MINKSRLFGIIETIKGGQRPDAHDLQLLVEAVELLDDLATTVDKIMHADRSSVILRDYRPDTTQEIRRVDGWGGERINDAEFRP